MSIFVQVLMAFGSVLVLLGLMAVVRKLAKSVGLSAEVQRKLVHIGTGLYALTLPWLFPARWPVYMLIATTLVVMAVLRLPRFSKTGLGATLHTIDRRSYGDFLLALSIGICFLLAQGNLLQYVLPIAVLTLADAAAALAGTVYGTKRFKVEESHKSVEGSAVFFAVTLVISLICLLLLADLPPLNVLALSLMIAAFGTLVEAQSWRGFDNLFLPLGLLIFLAVHGDSTLPQLAVLAGLFALSLAGFRYLGPGLGLNAHTGRVYVVVVFLLLAVTAVQNAALPVLVLVAHAWCRMSTPCNEKYPDLDVAASLALFSFGWLALGNATGWNAISFYGLSAMGLTMGLCVLALPPVRMRFFGSLAIAAALFGVHQGVVSVNPSNANWAGPMVGPSLVVLGLVAAATTAIPCFFDNDRVMKLTLLALAVPLGYYGFALMQMEKPF
ncbi:MAG: hypothetical protein JKX69_10790 [Rhodobacteraceae bacterium]|nr:hypothetical protein [Paracoccaceae bacterium]